MKKFYNCIFFLLKWYFYMHDSLFCEMLWLEALKIKQYIPARV